MLAHGTEDAAIFSTCCPISSERKKRQTCGGLRMKSPPQKNQPFLVKDKNIKKPSQDLSNQWTHTVQAVVGEVTVTKLFRYLTNYFCK